MDDLISRQAAIEALKRAEALTRAFGYHHVIKTIRELSSVQPEPKTGHWIKISPAGIYECSQCGQNVMTGDIEVYAYCHHCGAYMKEESDEAD